VKAALSLDLDNQWSYMKTHGDPGWESLPSYIDTVVPRALEMLEILRLKTTFFIVGMDADQPANARSLASIHAAGHEIGNHSYYHEPWLHRRTPQEIEREIALAEDAISAATGQRPRGFRGPGFVRSPEIYRVLARRGYSYDASTLPTFIGPLARAYYFRSTKLDAQARQERQDLFGSFSDGFEPNRVHLIETPDGTIAQIPVTTMPGTRLPIHISYLLYLARVSPALALTYFRTALALCRLTKTEPSILLHPLDYLDGSDCPALKFFPAMDMAARVKLSVVSGALRMLGDGFDVGPVSELVPAAQVSVPAYAAGEQ
jgi:peptidoglycan/xylan/chitin deacetylase (PgdA/CDA1 family)